jgi:hypothetical protein
LIKAITGNEPFIAGCATKYRKCVRTYKREEDITVAFLGHLPITIDIYSTV